MDNAFTALIIAGVVVFRVVLPLLKWLKRQGDEQQRASSGRPEQLETLRKRVQALAAPSGGRREQMEAIHRRLRTLIDRAEGQLSGLPSEEGPSSVIARALRTPTLSDLQGADRQLAASLDALGAGDSAAALGLQADDESARAAEAACRVGEDRLRLLAQASASRQGRMGEVMADADAFAGALAAPLRAFAFAHGLPLPPDDPICLPTDPGSEAMIRDLFADHPVIFVPRDFGKNIARWSAVAHEIGHVLWHAEPTLRREMARIQPNTEPPWLPRAVNGRLAFNIDAAFGGWLQEIVCDAFAVILLGPAGFRGLCRALDDEAEPLAATFAAPNASGQLLDEHPPPHLRVHLGAWLLNHLGYIVQAEPLLADWQERHGDADYLVLPVQGSRQTVAVDLARFMEKGTRILSEMMSEEFRGLGGYPLSAVSGQQLGPGEWARVERRAAEILAGESFHDTPRVAIAAGIEAAAASPASVRAIAAAVRSAIVGEGQRRSDNADYRGHPHKARGGHPVAMARDAILLHELLRPPLAARPAPKPRHR